MSTGPETVDVVYDADYWRENYLFAVHEGQKALTRARTAEAKIKTALAITNEPVRARTTEERLGARIAYALLGQPDPHAPAAVVVGIPAEDQT